MNSVPTVFLVDDDPAVLNSYAVLLRSMRLQCETFASGQEFLAQFDPERPGCLVLDVRMPHLGGPEIQARISQFEPCLPIVFITGFVDMSTAVKMIKLGALDFLQKGGSDAELLTTIQRALRIDEENRAKLRRAKQLAALLEKLSPAERDVLDQVLAGKPNKSIAGALCVSQRCIEARRAQIMSKLEVDNLPALVQLVCEYNVHAAGTPRPSSSFCARLQPPASARPASFAPSR